MIEICILRFFWPLLYVCMYVCMYTEVYSAQAVYDREAGKVGQQIVLGEVHRWKRVSEQRDVLTDKYTYVRMYVCVCM